MNKINSAHALGGPDLAVRTVKENFNIPIDNYAVVDTRGLTELFSLLGPFKVMVEKEMHYHDKTAHLDIDLMPGEQELQAKELVGYLRFRHDAMADIGRMERQQWFLRQALDKVKDPSILLKAPQLIKVGYDSINTDLSLDEIASIFSFGKDLKTKDLITATLPGHSETIEEVNYLVLSDAGSRAIFSKLGFNDENEYGYRRERYRSKLGDEDLETKRKRIRISLKCAAP
ncbi:MAG TPA: LCP family protein, partial [Candidatus Melainabacteria bacterium]|nr:LCP family protein [Candidatus Melainabacteria bacterium]